MTYLPGGMDQILGPRLRHQPPQVRPPQQISAEPLHPFRLPACRPSALRLARQRNDLMATRQKRGADLAANKATGTRQ